MLISLLFLLPCSFKIILKHVLNFLALMVLLYILLFLLFCWMHDYQSVALLFLHTSQRVHLPTRIQYIAVTVSWYTMFLPKKLSKKDGKRKMSRMVWVLSSTSSLIWYCCSVFGMLASYALIDFWSYYLCMKSSHHGQTSFAWTWTCVFIATNTPQTTKA